MPPRKKSAKTTGPRLADPMDLPPIREGVTVKPRIPFFSRPPVIIAILGTMLLCALYLWVAQPSPAPVSIPSTDAGLLGQSITKELKQDTEDPVSRVSSMILVNMDETPNVFTVSDAGTFRSETPQAGPVQVGDKVITWSDKTVVYSPSEKKIIAVYPTVPPVPPEPESDATIEIRNASGVAGAASRLKKSLTEAGFTVSSVGDAATRQDGNSIVDFSNGSAPHALTKLAGLSIGSVGPLPEGEPESASKILILIGR